jgi:hypothetical protein
MAESADDAVLRIFRWVMEHPEEVEAWKRKHVKKLETDFGILNVVPHPLFEK